MRGVPVKDTARPETTKRQPENQHGKSCRGKENAVHFRPAVSDALKHRERASRIAPFHTIGKWSRWMDGREANQRRIMRQRLLVSCGVLFWRQILFSAQTGMPTPFE